VGIRKNKVAVVANEQLFEFDALDLEKKDLFCEHPVLQAQHFVNSENKQMTAILSKNDKEIQYIMIYSDKELKWKSNDTINELGCHSNLLFNSLNNSSVGLFRSPSDITVELHPSTQTQIQSNSQGPKNSVVEFQMIESEGDVFMTLLYESG
jgi:hypothetical protein